MTWPIAQLWELAMQIWSWLSIKTPVWRMDNGQSRSLGETHQYVLLGKLTDRMLIEVILGTNVARTNAKVT